MNENATRLLAPGRMLPVIALLVVLLLASGLWNLRLYQLIERQRQRDLAAKQEETARIALAAQQAERERKKKEEWARSDARVQQLYREINNLSQINEHMLVQPAVKRSARGELSSGDQAARRR